MIHSEQPSHTTLSALTLQNVTVQYGSVSYSSDSANSVTALDDLSLDVKRGDQIAVVGPNGAGKSTLFNVITGFVKPTRGQVNVYGSTPKEHICIGYVPQRNQIDWRFPVSVYDVVMMGRVGQIGLFRRARQQDRKLVMDALAAVDMAHLAKRQIGELSGGQQQRVFLARTLAQETQLLLLDEPLAGLDVTSQETILSILANLRTRDITMLVAIHDLGQAAAHFDQLLLINHSMIACGSPSDVLTRANLEQAYGTSFPFTDNLQVHTGEIQPMPASTSAINPLSMNGKGASVHHV
ncbi:MAG: metal ABC transporter ATP-binding protein [Chloroflexota bacterium]